DVEAEHLLLHPQELVLLELLARHDRVVARPFSCAFPALVHGPEIEDRPLPGEAVGLLLLPPRERLLEHVEHPLARAGDGAALDERLDDALVRDRRVDALGEVPDRLERPFLARLDDRAARDLAD